MSGGRDQKLCPNKMQGWEEAGNEFYQESYPTDWEGFQRNTAVIATLLPSKKNRAATTRRKHVNNLDQRCGKRRQESATKHQNSTTFRSYGKDVQISMLPDLSQDLTDEEQIWDELQEIRSMTVTMACKKEIRTQLKNATKLRLQGFGKFKWQKRKIMYQLESNWRETLLKLELWRNSLKKIEGKFGTGVLAYFLFLKWLMGLNLIAFTLVFWFLLLPNLIFKSQDESIDENKDSESFSSAFYFNSTLSSYNLGIFDIIEGKGFSKTTGLFYGFYTNSVLIFRPYEQKYLSSNLSFEKPDGSNNSASKKIYGRNDNPGNYDLPLAYLITMALYFIITLIALLKKTLQHFQKRLVRKKIELSPYCNTLFGSWDFCLNSKNSSDIKHSILSNIFKKLLCTKRIDRRIRSWNYLCNLVVKRFIVNAIVLVLLIFAAISICLLLNISREFFKSIGTHISPKKNDFLVHRLNIETETLDRNEIQVFAFEFLPYVAIVCYHILVPILFKCFCKFERYSTNVASNICLWRNVLLRLSSLTALISHLYTLTPRSNGNGQCIEHLHCWETYVGQQFYKLVITDIFVHVFVTFFVNLPRSILYRHLNTEFSRLYVDQQFELSKHFVDLIFLQVVSLIGSFYCPCLPLLVTIQLFLMFYIKKFQCLVNSRPSTKTYGASESYSIFITTSLLSCTLAIAPVLYAVIEIVPSKSCGPFSGLNSVWSALLLAFTKMPVLIKNILVFLNSSAFMVSVITILSFLSYYFYTMATVNKRMVQVLKTHLVLEGHDKQFLLNRLSLFIKQHQDVQKHNRTINEHGQQHKIEPQIVPHNQKCEYLTSCRKWNKCDC